MMESERRTRSHHPHHRTAGGTAEIGRISGIHPRALIQREGGLGERESSLDSGARHRRPVNSRRPVHRPCAADCTRVDCVRVRIHRVRSRVLLLIRVLVGGAKIDIGHATVGSIFIGSCRWRTRRRRIDGFAVGVIENLGGAYIVGTELKLTMALVIIVAVLTVKPSGLLGRTVQSRV